MSKFAFSIIAAFTIVAFQNCGRDFASAATYMSENRGNSGDPNKLEVGTAVFPDIDSEVVNPIPLTVSKKALPLALDFSANPDWQENGTSWAYWIRSWKMYSPEDMKYLGPAKFFYRLDIFKGVVIDLASQNIVYKLSSLEKTALQKILDNSILANAGQFGSCTASDNGAYGSLETDYGMFELGQGSPCATIDLFRTDNSGKLAGMEIFLARIQNRIN
jgi:hypothetical protein